MSTDLIELWHQRARPSPGQREFDVQLGCHLEEIVEMLDCIVVDGRDARLAFEDAHSGLRYLALRLKEGRTSATITDRKEFLDAIADQIVTAVGAGHCAGMRVTEAVRRVNSSNWSKFVDGHPVFDANGKIAKGPHYKPVDLTGCFEIRVQHLPADDTEGGAL